MIKRITLTNIRGKSHEFVFDETAQSQTQVIRLKGTNGVGKTSFADALAFAFVGSDSQGTPAPTHLISDGQDKMSVVIDTGKSTIERSITRKKSQNLKLKVGDVTTPITQEDLTKRTCPKDVFLSAMIAGYFMSLPQERAMAVLREVVPPIDKKVVLEAIMGKPIDEHLVSLMDFSKPSDLIATKLTASRRLIEKEMATNIGKIAVHKEQVLAMDSAGSDTVESPSVVPRVNDLLIHNAAWDKYDTACEAYNRAAARREEALDTNTLLLLRKQNMEAQLAAIESDKPIPEVAKPILLPAPVAPVAPASVRLPDSERCHTCGQVVGSKHRESVAAQNAALAAEYNLALEQWKIDRDEVVKKNMAASAAYDRTCNEHTSIFNHNQQLAFQRRSLEKDIANTMTVPVPSEPTIPEPPTTPRHSAEEVSESRGVWERYNMAVASAKAAKATLLASKSEIARLEALVSEQVVSSESLTTIEGALKILDQEVFKKTEEYYALMSSNDLGKIRIHLDDSGLTVINDLNGFKYNQFSQGQRIYTDMMICQKIGALLHEKGRPVKFMFVDNYDLVSPKPENVYVETLITAEVTNDKVLTVSSMAT